MDNAAKKISEGLKVSQFKEIELVLARFYCRLSVGRAGVAPATMVSSTVE
jgi:hypothetical protein